MFQVLYALISLFVWGSEGIFDKKALNKLNIYNALVLRYSAVFFLVIFAAIIFTEIKFPSIQLIPYFLFTCFIGSTAIIFFLCLCVLKEKQKLLLQTNSLKFPCKVFAGKNFSP